MSMLLTAQAMKLKVGNPTRKLVLLKLADNANDKGECFPSYQHIADHCEVSRRSVISHIDALIKMGLVEKKSRKNQDGQVRICTFCTLKRVVKIFHPLVNEFHPLVNEFHPLVKMVHYPLVKIFHP